MGELIKVSQVAQTLGLSKSTVYRLIDRGQIEGVRMGRSVRVHPESVRLFVEHNSTGNKGTEE